MKSNYKAIGELVERIDERNRDGSITTLIGVSIDKKFIPSVANVVGTDLTNYKVIRKYDFAVSLMQVSRDEKIPVACQKEYDAAIMSPAYPIFRVKDTNIIMPEYLEMWFMRSEFDREASFVAVGGVRGSMPWEEFAKLKLPVPNIEIQKEIVSSYRAIIDRITLKKRINDNLEATAQAIYRDTIATHSDIKYSSIYSILSVINGSPFASELFNSNEDGYPLVRIRDLTKCEPVVYTNEVIKNMEYVSIGDILIGMDGEFIPHIWYGRTGVLNQRVCKVIPVTTTIHPLFLYFTLRPILAEVQRTQGGTTVIHIGKKDFDKMECPSLSSEAHINFSNKVTPIFNTMLCNYKEILNLQQLRDNLLSLLSR